MIVTQVSGFAYSHQAARHGSIVTGTQASLSACRWVTILPCLAEAKKRYLKVQANHREGKDPQGVAETVAELADLHIEHHAKPKKRIGEADRRILDKNILPRIGSMKIGKVRKCVAAMFEDALN